MYQGEKHKYAKISIICRSVLFVAVFLVLLAAISSVMASPPGWRVCYQNIKGFYQEREDSLDAVYIGSSAVYAYWQPTLGWDCRGIAVWSYATAKQPITAVIPILDVIQKTQPKALKIINIQGPGIGECEMDDIHRLTDYMPWSLTKLKLIHALCETGDYTLADRLEFYFPLIRFHSRWTELSETDFSRELNGTKGGFNTKDFRLKSTDVSSKEYQNVDWSEELSKEATAIYGALFDYIDQKDIPVLFISSPSLSASEAQCAGINRIMEMAEARGYPTLNLKGQQRELGIDPTIDYFDAGHTNIHGSIKYTEYLSNYLVEHYDFQDKRGQAGYESWDLAAQKYKEIFAPYVVEEELDADHYDSSLKAPELADIKVNGTTLTLRWKGVKEADTYHIYRQSSSRIWEFLAEVPADTLSYADKGLEVGREYKYTVIPQKERDGERFHGNYQFAGISETAIPNAPKLLELTGDGRALELTWEKVPGADGYAVYRKINGKSWARIADVGEKTEYRDTDLQGGDASFRYTVRAYERDEAGDQIFGSYDTIGLLYLPEYREDIGLTVSTEKDRILLSWDPVSGADRYYIERRTEDGDWTRLVEPVSGKTSSFQDITAEEGVSYRYRVTAALTYRKEEYHFASQETDTWVYATQDSVIVDRPEIVFAQRIGEGVELVWTPASNASAYRIYRKSEESDWKVLEESVTGNSYTDSALPKKASEISYLVQALYGPKGVVFCGEFSEDMAVTVGLGQEG